MICDTLDHAGLYTAIHSDFRRCFDWLAAFDPALPDGRHPIRGGDVFALVQSYETVPADMRRFETHRDFIDIQYVARGRETLFYAPAAPLAIAQPYDPARDFALHGPAETASAVVLTAGGFAIFFPPDAHKPGCLFDLPSRVRKVVVKVRVFPSPSAP